MRFFINNDRKRFYHYLLTRTSTCTQVALALSIPQKSCTRYKRYWEKRGLLVVTGYVRCPVTGRQGVQLLTSNPLPVSKEHVVRSTDYIENRLSTFVLWPHSPQAKAG